MINDRDKEVCESEENGEWSGVVISDNKMMIDAGLIVHLPKMLMSALLTNILQDDTHDYLS
jgi:hypothetical protein